MIETSNETHRLAPVPAGYRLDWKGGDYVFESPSNFEQEICKETARIWTLHDKPQPGCPQEVAVYKGPHWIQPKYVHGRDLTGFKPLYLGPLVQDWQ